MKYSACLFFFHGVAHDFIVSMNKMLTILFTSFWNIPKNNTNKKHRISLINTIFTYYNVRNEQKNLENDNLLKYRNHNVH